MYLCVHVSVCVVGVVWGDASEYSIGRTHLESRIVFWGPPRHIEHLLPLYERQTISDGVFVFV